MPLLHSTSSVSSPLTAGSVALLTLIVVTLPVVWETLLAVQNFVRSLVAGVVSMRMAMVWPLPVTPELFAS